ncbi:PEP-utilizing enzyme [Isoptericola sp. b490]|uniref:PEP-utilizing enzyme n=1 Tax=Actinotalea lenta TaxID=3064654 RepID=UPI002714142E|nr:PEP-utilizing enzyme [Isoptericola sp. b490]MDO8119768.1 PEP-utilizing enzyme [Isoptericola sp. b490]
MSTDPILGSFFGDDAFPVEWTSEAEKSQFWVYDDLHCPRPISPMYFDIGGWWLSCDHMFRRFGTPFASDWLAKNINGYVYTAAIPADPELDVSAQEYGARYAARVPMDGSYAERIGAYLNTVLPVYGLQFADWWRDRLVPEMKRNYAYLEERFSHEDELSLAEAAILLEDAIDIHDRHWKIHWMMNFAQLSATTGLEATAKKVKGDVDPTILARLQNSAADRNWDSIEALWKMKQEVVEDPELRRAFGEAPAPAIMAALEGSERGRTFLRERLEPYKDEYGWHAVWSHEVQYRTVVEDPTPVLDLIKGYVEQDYDYPSALEALRDDLDEAKRELLAGVEGEALAELSMAVEINEKMAPLTPDHHFYIDQGANAHLRAALLVVGRKLVALGVLEQPDDIAFLRYLEMRALVGDPHALDARAAVAEARRADAEALKIHPRDWVGTVTESKLNFPYWTLWGFPQKFERSAGPAADNGSTSIEGIAGSSGVVEGIAKVINTMSDFDQVQRGDVLVCQMTNPAWVVLFTKIAAVVTDTGGVASHPAVLAREFGMPAVVGTSVGTSRISSGDRLRVNGDSGVVEVLSHS